MMVNNEGLKAWRGVWVLAVLALLQLQQTSVYLVEGTEDILSKATLILDDGFFEDPTVTNVTLNGTIATAIVSPSKGFLAKFKDKLPDLLHLCPQGEICWKAAVDGPCLAITEITAVDSRSDLEHKDFPDHKQPLGDKESLDHKASLGDKESPGDKKSLDFKGSPGQASFDYATVLTPGTPFLAVALYKGSKKCKTAPSDDINQPPPGGVTAVLPTTITITAPAAITATAPATFTLALAVPGGGPVGGQNVTVAFGDGSPPVTVLTNTDGSITVAHTYATTGQYKVSATYIGSASYTGSSATTTVTVGPQPTSLSLTVASTTPVINQPVNFTVTLKSAGPGTPPLANKTITITYGDGSTGTGTSNANGMATFTHTYTTSGSKNVVATFAGDATYSTSTATATPVVGTQPTNTSLTITPSTLVATQPGTFAVTLKSAGPGTPPLGGKTIRITYGDGTTETATTDANGVATLTHTYATSGSKSVVATFPGDATYSASTATAAPVVSLQPTNIAITLPMAVATLPGSFPVTLTSAGPGSPPLANKDVTITYGDGTTETGTTNANGVAIFTHAYAMGGTVIVNVAFAGDATYAASSVTKPLVVTFFRIMAAGGFSGFTTTASTEFYDPTAGQWTTTNTPMVRDRNNFPMLLLPQGQVLAAGGNGNNGITATTELYSPTPRVWNATGSLAVARYRFQMVVLPNGKVLAAAGGGVASVLNSAELYSPALGVWNTTGPLAVPRLDFGMVLLPDGRVLAAGGSGSNLGALTSAELYSPMLGNWTTTGSLTVPRSDLQTVLLPNGKVLAAGGFNSIGASSVAELYDPAFGNWTTTGSLLTSRYRFQMVLLPNGKVLAAGGITNNLVSLKTAELYDPATGKWSAAADLSNTRHDFSMALIPNGNALVAGGVGNVQGIPQEVILTSAEVYNSTANAWTFTGPLTVGRYDYQIAVF